MDEILAFLLTGPSTRAPLVRGLGPRLKAALPVDRLWLGTVALHPLVAAGSWRWTAEEGLVSITLSVADRTRVTPPNLRVVPPGQLGHLRLAEVERGELGLPGILWDTYTAVAFAYFLDGERPIGAVTLGTRCAFSDGDLSRLRAVLPALHLALRLLDREELVVVIASTRPADGPPRHRRSDPPGGRRDHPRRCLVLRSALVLRAQRAVAASGGPAAAGRCVRGPGRVRGGARRRGAEVHG